jgi:hypothetical protein
VHARRLLLPVLAAAILATGALTASASTDVAASLVSKGRGTQTFEGGGLTYGTVGRSATILVVNLSTVTPSDLSVTIKGKPVKFAGGKLYTADVKSLAFKVSGSAYRLVIKGQSNLNGINVSGTADFKPAFPGAGSYSLNGGPFILWTKHRVDLGGPSTPPATNTP